MAKKKSAAKKATEKTAAAKKVVTKAAPAKKKAPASVARSEIQATGTATPDVLQPDAGLPEIAFYYPNPYWRDADWAKNLILFFDGIGMLIPNYMPDSSRFDDMAVIAGLKEHNLFHVFQPETFLDTDSAMRLTNAMTEIISSGVMDDLAQRDAGVFAELSMSRMGFHVLESGYAEEIFMQLEEAEARERVQRRGCMSIPMHPSVRYIILILLSQILRKNGRDAGFELHPATDESDHDNRWWPDQDNRWFVVQSAAA